jgi:hypothetical protein
MADSARDRRKVVRRDVAGNILTSSAQALLGTPRENYATTYRSWQDELWAYTSSVGEFGSVMNWFSAAISRMHLRAGIWRPGLKEPELVDTGTASDLVNDLVTNAKGGETQFLRLWAKHLFVPGVGYFLGEEDQQGMRRYDVKSADVIKRSAKQAVDEETGLPIRDRFGDPIQLYDIRIAPDRWRTTSVNSLIGRIFDPDPRYDYLPTSMTQGALTTLREIDMINRAIIASLLSRIAFNGILFIPTEATFAVNPQYKDAPDPFIAELLEYAQRGIKDPGSPGAAIPFPIRVSGVHIEQFKHLILSSGLDPKVIDARESAINRLKEQLPAPVEALSGLQDMNHWNAWKSSEDNIKLYFGPPMEVLCGGLTELFLHPMMLAEKKDPIRTKDGGQYVVWYDATDLTVQPDNSENAQNAFESGQITADGYLEAMGFDEEVKTKVDDQLRETILIRSAMSGTALSDGYFLLYPQDKPSPEQQAAEAAAAKGIDPAAAGDPARVGPSEGSPAAVVKQDKPAQNKPKAQAPA